jgi:hypothetical protein
VGVLLVLGAMVWAWAWRYDFGEMGWCEEGYFWSRTIDNQVLCQYLKLG